LTLSDKFTTRRKFSFSLHSRPPPPSAHASLRSHRTKQLHPSRRKGQCTGSASCAYALALALLFFATHIWIPSYSPCGSRVACLRLLRSLRYLARLQRASQAPRQAAGGTSGIHAPAPLVQHGQFSHRRGLWPLRWHLGRVFRRCVRFAHFARNIKWNARTSAAYPRWFLCALRRR